MAITVVVRWDLHGSESPLALTLEGPRLVIGRSEGCEIRLPDPSISARHASLRQRGSSYVLLDEGSVNGTFLDGVRLPPHVAKEIAAVEMVRVGRLWLEVRLEPLATPSPPQASRDFALALVHRALEGLGNPPTPRILVRSGPDQGKALELVVANTPLLLGRGHDCALALEERDASRNHVQIMRRGDTLWLRDLGSKNGSYLNNERLHSGQEVAWRAGQEVKIGTDVLVYENPALEMLADLDRCADEAIPTDEAQALSELAPAPLDANHPSEHTTFQPPRYESNPGATSPLAPRPRANDITPVDLTSAQKNQLRPGDFLIVTVAVVVFALSAFGLWILFRG